MDDESPDVPDDAVDLSNDETRERQAKRTRGELTSDDIQTPEIRKAVEEAEAKRKGKEDDEDDATTVELNEPPEPDDASDSDRAQEILDEMDEATGDTAGVTDDVDDDAVQDAMAEADLGGLNVRDDVDPEHFDYEDQDFEDFSAYGERVNAEYNGAVFLLKQPDERTQQQLMNEMQSSSFAGAATADQAMEQASMGEMMDMLISHTVERPEDIDDLVTEWSPFERMGLGLQCMEFLGLTALGNM